MFFGGRSSWDRASDFLERLLGQVDRRDHDLASVEVEADEPSAGRIQFEHHWRPP
jgi:hypothetical protein